MRLCIAVVLVAFFSVRAGGDDRGDVIPGTKVEMNLHDIYQWDRSTNSYRSLAGAGSMMTYYVGLPIRESIEKFRSRILKPFPFPLPPCEIDREWSEDENKHYLICRGKMREDWEIRTYVLFIAKQGETYLFISRLHPGDDPDAEAKVLAAYQSSRISDRPGDVRDALPYAIKPPSNYVLAQMGGTNSVYRIERGAGREPDYLSITWHDDEQSRQLDGYLSRFVPAGHMRVFAGAVRSSTKDRGGWKLVSFDPATKKYRVQLATRRGKHVLALDALIGKRSYQANATEIETLAAGVEAR